MRKPVFSRLSLLSAGLLAALALGGCSSFNEPTSVKGFLAFNATAHTLISTALSRNKEEQAAQIIARIAQLAVGISLVLGLGLYAGRQRYWGELRAALLP